MLAKPGGLQAPFSDSTNAEGILKEEEEFRISVSGLWFVVSGSGFAVKVLFEGTKNQEPETKNQKPA